MNVLKKIFDCLLIMKNYLYGFFMKVKTAFYSPSKISRSFWSSRNSKNWDLSSRYPELQDAQTKALIGFFNKNFKDKKIKMLDLGCSDGSSSIFIVKDYLRYGQGLDISSEFIKTANKEAKNNNINVDFSTWDACEEELKITNSFDVVMALGLFTCITEDKVFENIINAISTQVKKGTYLLIKDTLSDTHDTQKVLKNHLYAAKYRFIDQYVKDICDKGFKKLNLKSLYRFPSEPYASYFLIFEKL